MAQRRMVSVKIIDSAKFIKMPTSTQALYFHIVARADDDGIVEAFNVMRMTGSNEDDLKVLMGKEFVKVLNEDLVTFITDWHEHNMIRADRKIDSMYQHLLLQVVPDAALKEKKERADRRKLLMDSGGTSQGQPMDGIGKVRLGQGIVSLGEDSLSQDIKTIVPIFEPMGEISPKRQCFKPPTFVEVTEYCNLRSNSVDPQTFVDFYSSKGWMVGKSKMKDWKASVRTWERSRGNETNKPNSKFAQSIGTMGEWLSERGQNDR